MFTYFQHGRRHDPETGTDPVVGSRNPWALYRGGLSVASPGAQTFISLTEFVYGPKNQTTYALDEGSGPLGGKFGVGVHEFGVYRGWWDFEFAGYTNGDIVEAAQPDDLGINANWFFGGQQNNADALRVTLGTNYGSIRFAKMVFVGGDLYDPADTLPRLHIPSVQAVGSSASFDVACHVVIEQMSKTYADNLSPGTTP